MHVVYQTGLLMYSTFGKSPIFFFQTLWMCLWVLSHGVVTPRDVPSHEWVPKTCWEPFLYNTIMHALHVYLLFQCTVRLQKYSHVVNFNPNGNFVINVPNSYMHLHQHIQHIGIERLNTWMITKNSNG